MESVEPIGLTEQVKTTEIAKNLNIAESTVRKYSQILEKEGYEFVKDLFGSRIYKEKDEQALSSLIAVRNKYGYSLEMSANIVATRAKESGDIANIEPLPEHTFSLAKEQLEKRMIYEMQTQVIKEMTTLFEDIEAKAAQENQIFKEQLENKFVEENRLLRESLENKFEEENQVLKTKLDETNEMMKLILEKQNEVKEPVIDEEKELLKTKLDEMMTLLLEKKNEVKEESVVVEEKKGWFKNIFK